MSFSIHQLDPKNYIKIPTCHFLVGSIFLVEMLFTDGKRAYIIIIPIQKKITENSNLNDQTYF